MISDETMYGHVIYKRMKKSRFLKGLQNIFLNFFFFVCFFSDTSDTSEYNRIYDSAFVPENVG